MLPSQRELPGLVLRVVQPQLPGKGFVIRIQPGQGPGQTPLAYPWFSAFAFMPQPYGAGLEEHWVSATLTWRMSPRVRWLARYGYGTSMDDTSGGNNDYDVHLLQASMQYRF